MWVSVYIISQRPHIFVQPRDRFRLFTQVRPVQRNLCFTACSRVNIQHFFRYFMTARFWSFLYSSHTPQFFVGITYTEIKTNILFIFSLFKRSLNDATRKRFIYGFSFRADRISFWTKFVYIYIYIYIYMCVCVCVWQLFGLTFLDDAW